MEADLNIKLIKACKFNSAPAGKNGNIELIQQLLQQGADPNFKQSDGTPLIWAVATNKIEAVKLLCEAGADPNLQESKGFAPLHSAASFALPEISQYLLESGANPNIQDKNGNTPLHWINPLNRGAILNEQVIANLKNIQVLVDAGADATLVNRKNLTPKDVVQAPEFKEQLTTAYENTKLSQYADQVSIAAPKQSRGRRL